jgi:hypothetical protein
MTMAFRLGPCPGCHRHVRIDEGSCPFCGETLTLEARSPSVPRIGRVAAIAAMAAAGASGCGDPGSAMPEYGAPVVDAGDVDMDDGGSDMNGGGDVPLYGAPDGEP